MREEHEDLGMIAIRETNPLRYALEKLFDEKILQSDRAENTQKYISMVLNLVPLSDLGKKAIEEYPFSFFKNLLIKERIRDQITEETKIPNELCLKDKLRNLDSIARIGGFLSPEQESELTSIPIYLEHMERIENQTNPQKYSPF